MKKKIVLLSTISLFLSGVVTDDSVSVYEGDSVTLHTNTDIQKDYLIDWRFGDQWDLIARINGDANLLKIYDDVLDGRFRDRLQVNNQTGDLTITDITTQHTGLYKLEITNKATTTKTFIFSVFGDKQRVKTVTVGDSVILHNNVTKKPDEKMMWRIRHNNSPVAEIKALHADVHERFRDRLYVNAQTGNLIITNIRNDDFGSYEVDLTVGSHTIHRSFNVRHEDQSSSKSSGVIAGLCVVVLLLAVALAVSVFLYRRRSRTARNGDRKNKRAQINMECCGGGGGDEDDDGDDGDEDDDGAAAAAVGGGDAAAAAAVGGGGGGGAAADDDDDDDGAAAAADDGGDDGEREELKVDEGESVYLKTKVTDIQRVEKIEWRFNETLIAEINPANNIFSTYDGGDNIFRGKLELNPQTGDLNIKNFTQEHTGVYTLKITRDGETLYRRFNVSVREEIETEPLIEGKSATSSRREDPEETRGGDPVVIVMSSLPKSSHGETTESSASFTH